MRLTDTQLAKIFSNRQTLQVIEQITSVPWVLLAVLWFYTNNLKLSCQDDAGSFKIRVDYWTPERITEALLEYPRLSAREAYNLAARPAKTFFLNGLLAATTLRKSAQVGIYPDMSERAIAGLLAGYMSLYELGNPTPEDIIDLVIQIERAAKEYDGAQD